MEDTEGNLLNHNFRPIQPINDRIVWFNSNDFEMNDNEISEDTSLNNDKIENVTIPSKKKRKNSGVQIEVKASLLIISLSFVALLKVFVL